MTLFSVSKSIQASEPVTSTYKPMADPWPVRHATVVPRRGPSGLSLARTASSHSFFRYGNFDAGVFVRFDPATYDITSAIEVSAAAVQALAKASAHMNVSSRVHLSDDLMLLDGSVNRTSDFREARLTLG